MIKISKLIAFFFILGTVSCNIIENEHSVPGINQEAHVNAPSVSEAVDLGLSVKWAPFNIGAHTETDFGYYFAYGEVNSKSSYNSSNYIKPENKNELGNIINTSSDAAFLNWGENWRMPSDEEIKELTDLCKWEICTIDNVRGYRVTGKNGNSIFLPAAGIYTDEKIFEINETGFYINSSDKKIDKFYFKIPDDRFWGYSIRPVLSLMADQSDKIKVPSEDEAIDLGLSVKWAPYNVGATTFSEVGNYYAYGEVEPKNSYYQSDYKEPSKTNFDGSIIGTEYDVAKVKWGKNWRMPTAEEAEELINGCKINATEHGLGFTGKNGNTLVLPECGYADGYSLIKENTKAHYRNGSSKSLETKYFNLYNKGYLGAPVRPVLSRTIKQTDKISVPDISESVDLGLSVRWAPYNVGAQAPSDYGNLYAYGETEFKEVYSTQNYIPVTSDITGTDKDVAHVKWGKGWRMPTKEEVMELFTKCAWNEELLNGVKGIRISSMEGNSIFLPYSGVFNYGYLLNHNVAGYYRCGSNEKTDIENFNIPEPFLGATVRPVIDNDYFEETVEPEDFINVEFYGESHGNYENVKYGNDYEREEVNIWVSLDMSHSFENSNIVDYGIIVYHNEEEVAVISKNGDYYVELPPNNNYNTTASPQSNYDYQYHYMQIKCKKNDFYLMYDNEYYATIAKSYKYRKFYTISDTNGVETRIVYNKSIPLDLKYRMQPDLKLNLSNYYISSSSSSHLNLVQQIEVLSPGALFFEKLYIVDTYCDEIDINKLKALSSSEKSILEGLYITDYSQWYSITNNLQKNSNKRYLLQWIEGICQKGNSKQIFRSNIMVVDLKQLKDNNISIFMYDNKEWHN